MLRKLLRIGLLSFVSCSLGCALCCSPDDYNYGAYGGRWQRHDLSGGRVGSAFAEAGFDSLADVVEYEPAAEAAPITDDEYIEPASYDEVSSYVE